MAKSFKFEGEILMTTDDEDELSAEQAKNLVVEGLEMGLTDHNTGVTLYMENGDFEVTEEGE